MNGLGPEELVVVALVVLVVLLPAAVVVLVVVLSQRRSRDPVGGPDGRPEPTHFREAFRRRGPSNYFHGIQAELSSSDAEVSHV